MPLKKKPYARPRWDDVKNFMKALEDERDRKVNEHPVIVRKNVELEQTLRALQLDLRKEHWRLSELVEEARCARDAATASYLELSSWVDAQRRKKKGLRGLRP